MRAAVVVVETNQKDLVSIGQIIMAPQLKSAATFSAFF